MFSFDNVSTEEENKGGENRVQVLKPAIYTVLTTELKSGVTEKGVPFIDWTVKDKNSEGILTHRYHVGTTVNEGKKMSSWDISAPAFLQLVSASNKIDLSTAKTRLSEIANSSDSTEKFTLKLSAMVVGKLFKLKVNGEEVVHGTSGNKFVKSKFGNFKFAVSTETEDSKLGKIYIKPLVTTHTTEPVAEIDKMPWE